MKQSDIDILSMPRNYRVYSMNYSQTVIYTDLMNIYPNLFRVERDCDGSIIKAFLNNPMLGLGDLRFIECDYNYMFIRCDGSDMTLILNIEQRDGRIIAKSEDSISDSCCVELFDMGISIVYGKEGTDHFFKYDQDAIIRRHTIKNIIQ